MISACTTNRSDRPPGAVAWSFEKGRSKRASYTIAVILLIAGLLGLVGTFTIGLMLHVLLVIAIGIVHRRIGERASYPGIAA